MLLKSLELLGFKSFPERTVIDFHSGVTGIVGPNGCGKSNVVDAVKWVLGETSAKALRGGEMADVIFNGTDRREPLGLAEVTLTLSDCDQSLAVDYNEVAITRRVYRDGKGEYAINGTACRLRDINELFMDTGIGQSAYSIMEQGKIDQLLSSKPEDRRAVFEEAAGITKFKTQKREALRKLEYTEANLLRVTDIIAELRRQMASMQRQAQKARRYQELHRELRVLDTHLSHRRWVEWFAEKAELETSIGSLSAAARRLGAGIASHEGQVEDLRRELERTDAHLALLRSQVNEQNTRIHGARNRIEFNGERRRELESLIARNEDEVAATEARLAQQEDEIKCAEDALAAIERNIERQHIQISDHAERAARHREDRIEVERELRDVRRFSQQAENAIISANARLSHNRAQIETDTRRHEQLGADIERVRNERTERLAEEHQLGVELASIARQREEEETRLNQAQNELRQTQAEVEEAQRQLNHAHKTLAVNKSRLEVLEQLVAAGEGLEAGTREVLGGLDQPEFFGNHVRGLLSSYLEVEPAFVRAIEAALGHHLQAVLVSDTAVAEAIIGVLTRDRRGEAVLLAESFIPRKLPRQLSTLPEGSTSWAADRVTVKEPMGPVIDHLLGNVLIVPNLETALRLRESLPEIAFATLDGEFISAHGIIRGGRSTEETCSILQRQNDIRSLREVVAECGERVAISEASTAAMAGMATGMHEHLAEAARGLHRTRLEESSLHGQLVSLRKDLVASQNRIDSVEWEQSEVAKRREALNEAMAEIDETLAQSKRQLEAHARRAGELDQMISNAARRESESAELFNELKTALAVEQRAGESLRQQRDPMMSRLRELASLIERRRTEIASHEERTALALVENERLGIEIESCEAEVGNIDQAIRDHQHRRGTQVEEIAGLERALAHDRRELSAVAEQRGREEVKVTQVTLRLENLEAQVAERYHTSLAGFEADVHSLLSTLQSVRSKWLALERRRATLAGRGKVDIGDERAAAETPTEGEPSSDGAITGAAESADDEFPAGLVTGAEEIDWGEVGRLVGELKQRLDSMGPVNLDAIQEFEELEERFNFLDREHIDLTSSKAELLKIIQRINTETRRMFAETFQEVRRNFQKTFRELFGQGAYSNLVLVDEDDPLESGIEIIAKPPGKKAQSISLLSGGERSMTAVALLFSIYMVKPAPFCVLDELDAPLDESNIGRFLQMLDQFIDRSQFVIVTHNKRTMRRADVLYGIAMEEFGVSKPVGMKMTSEEPAGAAG